MHDIVMTLRWSYIRPNPMLVLPIIPAAGGHSADATDKRP